MGAAFADEDQVLYLLRGLQGHLETPRATIRGFQSQGQPYSFNQALSFLVASEAAAAHDQPSRRLPLLSRPVAHLVSGGTEPRRFQLYRNPPNKTSPGYFNGECRHCHKWGHKFDDCMQRKREIDSGSASGERASAKVAQAENTEEPDRGNRSDDEGEVFELIDEKGEVYFARLAVGSAEEDTSEAKVAFAMVAKGARAEVIDLTTPEPELPLNHPLNINFSVNPLAFETIEEMAEFQEACMPRKAVKWILDSGATHHMTSQPDLLPVRVCAPDGAVVHIADGTTAEVTRRGACVAWLFGDGGSEATALLRTVLVVPSFTNNLLSVQRLTEDGWVIKFTSLGAELLSPTGDKVQTFTEPATGAPYVMLMSEHSRVIDIKGVSRRIGRGPAKATARVATEGVKRPGWAELADFWHKRLGHMGLTSLLTLSKDPAFAHKDRPSPKEVVDFIAEGRVCDPCVESKQPLLSFGVSVVKPEAKMDDIHFDLAGPFEGNKDYKYAMQILDEWSRMIWTHPLPNKEAS
ncbi:unnamed protein product, partial [Tilletia controversa]